ncbi:hypothetical protein [Corallococcus sp. 4LFB]|uniref:DUF7107 domain-containing protein n=1 Tax=Corallococcus sp. 4LFB TaxID=3383249 RepID=UPI003974D4E1
MNCECPSGEVCTSGKCKLPPAQPSTDAGTTGTVCRANCECPAGQMCASGQCKPVNHGSGKVCQANCECPSGERCQDNVCWL